MTRQGKSLVSEGLATDDTRLGFESLASRLERYGRGKYRALRMSDYIRENVARKWQDRERYDKSGKLSSDLRSCGSYLVFKRYFNVDEVRLHAAEFCHKHMLCPFCAMRRGVKYVQAYEAKLREILKERPALKAYMVTLTVKDGDNLLERFQNLRGSMKRYQQQRRDVLKRGGQCEYAKAAGGVFSIEVKRGSGSGMWHPHAHMVWLCETAPDARKLSEEWRELTGDSYIVDVRQFYGDDVIDGFLEVFKYALKFSDMELADNWHAYTTLKGKRMVDCFGLFRGVKVDEELTDEDLDDANFQYLLYRFAEGSGYNYDHDGSQRLNRRKQEAEAAAAEERAALAISDDAEAAELIDPDTGEILTRPAGLSAAHWTAPLAVRSNEPHPPNPQNDVGLSATAYPASDEKPPTLRAGGNRSFLVAGRSIDPAAESTLR